MTEQYLQRFINLGPGAGSVTYVYDTAGTPSETVFTDWDELIAQLSEVQGEKIIFVALGNQVVPAGTYDMTDICIRGVAPGASALFIDDVVFQNLNCIDSVTLQVGSQAAANTVPSFQYDDGAVHFVKVNNAVLNAAANAAVEMIEVSNGSTLQIISFSSYYGTDTAATPLVTVDATSTFIAGGLQFTQSGNVWGQGNGVDPFLVVAGGGTANLNKGTGDVYWASSNPNGFTTVNLADDYEPGNGANWVDPDPQNVQDALDRIAAQLAAVGAAPIP